MVGTRATHLGHIPFSMYSWRGMGAEGGLRKTRAFLDRNGHIEAISIHDTIHVIFSLRGVFESR